MAERFFIDTISDQEVPMRALVVAGLMSLLPLVATAPMPARDLALVVAPALFLQRTKQPFFWP